MANSSWFVEKQLLLARIRLPWMREKVERGMDAWRSTFPADAAAGKPYEQAHRGADGNNWLCTAVPEGAGMRLYTLMWWNRKGQVDAVQVVPDGRAFHFYGHLFSQYRARVTRTRDLVFNLHQFFKYNHQLKAMHLPYKHSGRWAVAGVVPEGLVLGTVNGPHLISCKTFIPRDQLNRRKAALHDKLLAHQGDRLPPSHSADLEGLHEEE
ncbi:MAG: hypothetical protein IPM46_11165 [Flavobacteriales bacterium]|nr:hypothetical protein [Flavobacteriales bacterium]